MLAGSRLASLVVSLEAVSGWLVVLGEQRSVVARVVAMAVSLLGRGRAELPVVTLELAGLQRVLVVRAAERRALG